MIPLAALAAIAAIIWLIDRRRRTALTPAERQAEDELCEEDLRIW